MSVIKQWLEKLSLKHTSLHYRLNVVFGLFFLFPILGFLYFCVKYDILNDKEMPLFFLGILLFSFFGIFTLRVLFDEIVNLSKALSEKVIIQPSEDTSGEKSEMERLIRSFNSIEGQFSNTFRLLEKKASDISILKELSDLCYVTFDPEEIMYVTLERALAITDSEIGSILMFEKQDKSAFVVKASIGLGEHVRIGDKIDFDTSIAKYAVINKTPLVVQDIEKDSRFGRRNRPQYGTKSFVCMPIKTSKDIVGVLTLSRRDQIRGYFPEDIEPLIPLLSNAAFTYENLKLLRDNEQLGKHIQTIGKIFKILSSGLRDSELIHTLLNEIRTVVKFDLALVLTRDENHPDHIVLTDFVGDAAHLMRGNSYRYDGSVIASVFKQRSSLIISDIASLVCYTDKKLLAAPGIHAVILSPLCTDGIVKGVLVLCSNEAYSFAQSKAMIERLSKVISLAIERDLLRSSVFKRKQELDTIRQIGRALASSTFDLEKVLDYTLDMIRIMMNAEAGTLYMTQDNMIESTLSFNILGKAPHKFRMKMGQGIAGYVAAGGEAVIITDAKASAHFYPDIDKETGFDTRSVLCVPMISQGKVIGVLQVINKISGAFSNNDEELLQSIASSVSIAIENARLYKETVAMAEHERDIRRMFQKFVPEEIVDKIIYGDNSGKIVLNELKTVTLLNIDIRGFSVIARKIGPQKTVAMLNNFFSAMGGIVFKHHGIIDKYLGDGFLAVFGAPVSGTQDADNAIFAALEMKSAVESISSYCLKAFGESVIMGVSIHTGETVVGNIGFDMKMDYTVIGDPVNSVFRLQNIAKTFPNGILIGEQTCRVSLSHLRIREVDENLVRDLEPRLGNFKVFELLGIGDE